MRTKTQPTNSRMESVSVVRTNDIARYCRKKINDEKAKVGQHRDNSKRNSTGVKQSVAALETSAPQVPAGSASS